MLQNIQVGPTLLYDGGGGVHHVATRKPCKMKSGVPVACRWALNSTPGGPIQGILRSRVTRVRTKLVARVTNLNVKYSLEHLKIALNLMLAFY